MIQHAMKKNIAGVILFLDFKKVFDTLEWIFMFTALKRYNFGDNFMKWVKILYNSLLACIKNNGWISETFELQRVVRQGCPLSALLFIYSLC